MKVILAFSGGLDTTYCAIYLSKELGHEVHAVSVNTGGFNENEINALEEKAKSLGVASFKLIEITQKFYEEGVRYLLFGNVLKNNTYPLSVSAERVFQAKAIAQYANEMGAEAIAHGSTGAGNDQVRFDAIFYGMCPGVEIITPIRDKGLSREEEINFLKDHGVEGNWKKSKYSINKGLWGTSVGGAETLTSDQYLPEDAFTKPLQKAEPNAITLAFEKGEPVAINGKKLHPLEVIVSLEEIASKYAIGRDIHVGDTIIGIKGRVGFEAAAALILIKAHHLLEKHTLSKHQLFIKDQLSAWYGNLMHEGNYLDPAMRDIESYLESSQESVSGEVYILLSPYHFQIQGIQSPNDLMQSSFGKYGEENSAWTGDDARGFAKIYSNQSRIINAVKND